jgi:hypothetical protein
VLISACSLWSKISDSVLDQSECSNLLEPPFLPVFGVFARILYSLREEVYCWGWTLFYAGFLVTAASVGTSPLSWTAHADHCLRFICSRRFGARWIVDLMSAQEAGADGGGHSKATKGNGMTLYRFKVALDQILYTPRRMLWPVFRFLAWLVS